MSPWKILTALLICAVVLLGFDWGALPRLPRATATVPPQSAQPAETARADDPAELLQEKAALHERVRAEPREPAEAAEGLETEPAYGLAPALDPIDPLMPKPSLVPAVWQGLDHAVRAIAGNLDGHMSVVAIDLTTGERYAFRPNDRYYPASTFKLPVTLCTVEAIERGELTWETLVTFTPEDDDTVGQGGFADVAYGTKWTVRNLLDRSIISSNNVAVKMLARTLTWDGLAACTERIGGRVTRTVEGSTPVTAADEAAWWLHLWQMKQERPKVAENLLSPLRRVTYYGRIQEGTPRSDLVTHKFGTYPPYEHDGALIWADRPYILVVMTYTQDHVGIDWTIAQVAAAAWDSIMAAK
jgi:beta-lactamase class A